MGQNFWFIYSKILKRPIFEFFGDESKVSPDIEPQLAESMLINVIIK